ncbi:hypothetical protein B0J13DRAFT_216485 [Dactylonectria estremocensis]|uniref:Uncharacterized protein n=1 Tax=Dactylonectria estremocensis TaxID=1079267 RepID=A0A9P9F3V4_9HYPO|nr:hypothetical protein B0J13DRAFT_216485 [Dactylonectria estremocensis]
MKVLEVLDMTGKSLLEDPRRAHNGRDSRQLTHALKSWRCLWTPCWGITGNGQRKTTEDDGRQQRWFCTGPSPPFPRCPNPCCFPFHHPWAIRAIPKYLVIGTGSTGNGVPKRARSLVQGMGGEGEREAKREISPPLPPLSKSTKTPLPRDGWVNGGRTGDGTNARAVFTGMCWRCHVRPLSVSFLLFSYPGIGIGIGIGVFGLITLVPIRDLEREQEWQVEAFCNVL